jgi:hypothetical protein
MPVAVTDLVMDVAITNFAEQRCEVLYSGPSHQPLTVDEGRYKKAGTVVRLHVCLMGETRPALSPLSVDVATDRDYCVYRYDWVFGIRGLTEWDWKSKLRDEALVVQLTMRLGAPNIGCTCVAAKLNVLPPSRDTSTWAERNPDTVVGLTKGAADLTAAAVGSPVVGIVTKVAAALSNSLASRGKRKTNWYLYQYVDGVDQAVEWHVRRRVLDEYGPLLRGSLMLAFHGGAQDGSLGAGGILLRVRPLMAFRRGILLRVRRLMAFRRGSLYTRYFGDDLGRVSPLAELGDSQKIELRILPGEKAAA